MIFRRASKVECVARLGELTTLDERLAAGPEAVRRATADRTRRVLTRLLYSVVTSAPLPYRVICISRVTGSGGDEIGRFVAKELGFRYVDDEIIAWAAEKGGVSPSDIADAGRRKSLLHRVLDNLGSGLGAERQHFRNHRLSCATTVSSASSSTSSRGSPAAATSSSPRMAPPLSSPACPMCSESTSQRRRRSDHAGIGIGRARSKSGSQVDPRLGSIARGLPQPLLHDRERTADALRRRAEHRSPRPPMPPSSLLGPPVSS